MLKFYIQNSNGDFDFIYIPREIFQQKVEVLGSMINMHCLAVKT